MNGTTAHALGINSYEGRWRWWYMGIADWMIRNPGGLIKDCALELNKSPNTISSIVNTDLFKDYFAKRKAEWSRDHDFAIRHKLTEVAELALDATVEKLQKQRDKIDLPLLTDLLSSSLDRLGFAPQSGPVVQVNQQFTQDNSTKVVQLPGSVTALALEEARRALRVAQSQYLLPSSGAGHQKGAEPPAIEYESTPAPSGAEPEEVLGGDSSTDS